MCTCVRLSERKKRKVEQRGRGGTHIHARTCKQTGRGDEIGLPRVTEEKQVSVTGNVIAREREKAHQQ